LCRTDFCSAAAALRASPAILALSAAAAVSLPGSAAATIFSLPFSTAAVFLTAAAVAARPALTLGRAFRRDDERSRKRHGRGEQ
jgi:hypothetical protein